MWLARWLPQSPASPLAWKERSPGRIASGVKRPRRGAAAHDCFVVQRFRSWRSPRRQGVRQPLSRSDDRTSPGANTVSVGRSLGAEAPCRRSSRKGPLHPWQAPRCTHTRAHLGMSTCRHRVRRSCRCASSGRRAGRAHPGTRTSGVPGGSSPRMSRTVHGTHTDATPSPERRRARQQ